MVLCNLQMNLHREQSLNQMKWFQMLKGLANNDRTRCLQLLAKEGCCRKQIGLLHKGFHGRYRKTTMLLGVIPVRVKSLANMMVSR